MQQRTHDVDAPISKIERASALQGTERAGDRLPCGTDHIGHLLMGDMNVKAYFVAHLPAIARHQTRKQHKDTSSNVIGDEFLHHGTKITDARGKKIYDYMRDGRALLDEIAKVSTRHTEQR